MMSLLKWLKCSKNPIVLCTVLHVCRLEPAAPPFNLRLHIIIKEKWIEVQRSCCCFRPTDPAKEIKEQKAHIQNKSQPKRWPSLQLSPTLRHTSSITMKFFDKFLWLNLAMEELIQIFIEADHWKKGTLNLMQMVITALACLDNDTSRQIKNSSGRVSYLTFGMPSLAK